MINVLIPTDFSDYSANAIRYASEYFTDEQVNFFIMHVLKSTHETAEFYDPSEPMVVDAPVKLIDKHLRTLNLQKNKKHKFFSVYEKESLVEAVRRQVNLRRINLIVMGTKGFLRLEKESVISHTYQVITKVQCPIMVIPEHATFSKKMDVSFVTDFNSMYRNEVLQRLTLTLETHNSPLRILKPRMKRRPLTATQLENKQFINTYFQDWKHSFHFLKNENLESGIQQFVQKYNIGMITIPARNLNFIQKLLLRTYSDEISYHLEVPFFVIHE